MAASKKPIPVLKAAVNATLAAEKRATAKPREKQVKHDASVAKNYPGPYDPRVNR